MPRRKNKNRRSPIIFFCAAIGIAVVALAVIFKLLFTKCPYFNIAKVTIKPIDVVLNSDFAKGLIGKNIFLVDLASLKNRIEKESKDTECVLIQRRLPSELVLLLRERAAIAQLKAIRFYRIDALGAVMDGVSDIAFPELPIIIGLPASSAGREDRIRVKDNKGASISELKGAIELIQEKNSSVNLKNYKIAKINISKDKANSFFITKNFVDKSDISEKNASIAAVEIKFDLNNPRETIRVLGLLLNKYNGKLEDIEYLDLKKLNSPVVLEKKTETKIK